MEDHLELVELRFKASLFLVCHLAEHTFVLVQQMDSKFPTVDVFFFCSLALMDSTLISCTIASFFPSLRVCTSTIATPFNEYHSTLFNLIFHLILFQVILGAQGNLLECLVTIS